MDNNENFRAESDTARLLNLLCMCRHSHTHTGVHVLTPLKPTWEEGFGVMGDAIGVTPLIITTSPCTHKHIDNDINIHMRVKRILIPYINSFLVDIKYQHPLHPHMNINIVILQVKNS